jgi:hypothetical protein
MKLKHTCTDACSKETLDIENEGAVDIDGLIME